MNILLFKGLTDNDVPGLEPSVFLVLETRTWAVHIDWAALST